MSYAEKMSPRHVGIVVACCLTCGIPAGMLMNTAGIFYPIIADDLGVQTAEISAWMAICFLSSAIFQPIFGNIVGRVHMRTMMLFGSLIAIGVFAAFAQASEPWIFWLAAIFTGITFATCLSVGPATLVNRWFNKHVGLIMGVVAGSSALGGVIFMFVGQAIIESIGWRMAYWVYSAVILIVCVPMVLLLVRDDPASCGLLPYGKPAVEDAGRESEAAPASDDKELRRAAAACMRTPAFFLLILAGFLMNVAGQVNGYFPKYVYWIEDQAAVGIMPMAFVTGVVLSSLTQGGSAVGKVALGAFSDLSVMKALCLLCGSGAFGLICVWLFPDSALIVLGAFIFGFFLASVLVLMPMLVREVFGAGRLYPLLYARAAAGPALGGAFANLLWPTIADNMGGFDVVFGLALVMVVVIFVSAFIALRLPKRELLWVD